MTLSLEDVKNTLKEKEPEPLQLRDCVGWVSNIKDHPVALKYLIENNCLEAYELYPKKFFYDKVKDRLVFCEYKSATSFSIATGRSLSGQSPKWYKYKTLPYSYFTINKPNSSSPTVIVEDCASACSVSRIASGLALCGTSWNLGALLSVISTKDVVVSLDADAILKTLQLQRDLLGVGKFRSVKVIRPRDDIKYLDKNELFELLYKGEEHG